MKHSELSGIFGKFGDIDEIHVEMGRELKQDAKAETRIAKESLRMSEQTLESELCFKSLLILIT